MLPYNPFSRNYKQKEADTNVSAPDLFLMYESHSDGHAYLYLNLIV